MPRRDREIPIDTRDKVGGTPIQYSTKERTHIIENDRFMMVKKVAVERLPDPSDNRLEVNDQIPTMVERSAA